MDKHVKYRAFVETVKCGSFTAAANILNYTQPGISRIISGMEEDFGFRLFNRSKSGVSLTEEGKRVYELCLSILEKENMLDQTIGQINGSLIGTIRLGAYYSVLLNWMPDIMETMHTRYPEVEFQIFEGNAEEQLNMLKKNTIDIGILSSSAPEDFNFIPLYMDPFVIAMSKGHPLTEFDVVEPDEIAQYQILQKPEYSSGHLRVLLFGQNNRIQSNYTTRSDNALLGLASKGLGIGIVGEMVAKSNNNIEYRHIKSSYYRTLGLVVPGWKPITPALQCLIDVIIELYQSEEFKEHKKGEHKR